MNKTIQVETLHIDDETFRKMRVDADQVLQKLLKSMAEKGSLDGRLTIAIDISFTEETVQNKDSNIEGDIRVVHTPKFQHKVSSVLQIKNEQKGDMNCDGMEMVYDELKKEYVLRPITGREQMNIYDFDMEYTQPDNGEFVNALSDNGEVINALPNYDNPEE